MRLILILIALSLSAHAGPHDDTIPGSAFFRFTDLYGNYDISLEGEQAELRLRAKIFKITGYNGAISWHSKLLGHCRGRYKIPLVGKISSSERPVIIVYSQGSCQLEQRSTRFAAALYFPHALMGAAAKPMQAIFWLGGINGKTLRFRSGSVIKKIEPSQH